MSSTEKSIRNTAKLADYFRTKMLKVKKNNDKIIKLKDEIVEEVSLDNEETLTSIAVNNIRVYIPEQTVRTLKPNVKYPMGSERHLKKIHFVAIEKFNQAKFECSMEISLIFEFQEEVSNIKIKHHCRKYDEPHLRIFDSSNENGVSLIFYDESEYSSIIKIMSEGFDIIGNALILANRPVKTSNQ